MSLELSNYELSACRAFDRIYASKTEGWEEAEYADAHWDGGEWSGPAWADNWQRVEEECYAIVGERFGMSAEYVCRISDMKDEHEFRGQLHGS